MILVYLGRQSYEKFQNENNIFYKMKNDLSTGTWQDDIWCSIIIILFCTSDEYPVYWTHICSHFCIIFFKAKSHFHSPFSRLVVMLSAGALVSASCHIPFVELIVMLSAGTSPPPLITSRACAPPPPPLVMSLSFLSLCLLLCHCLSSHLPLLWMIVMLLPTGTSAPAASMAKTCPLLWWLIVLLLMQHYCCRTAIGEYNYGASLLQCCGHCQHLHYCCSGGQHCGEVCSGLLVHLHCCCFHQAATVGMEVRQWDIQFQFAHDPSPSVLSACNTAQFSCQGGAPSCQIQQATMCTWQGLPPPPRGLMTSPLHPPCNSLPGRQRNQWGSTPPLLL